MGDKKRKIPSEGEEGLCGQHPCVCGYEGEEELCGLHPCVCGCDCDCHILRPSDSDNEPEWAQKEASKRKDDDDDDDGSSGAAEKDKDSQPYVVTDEAVLAALRQLEKDGEIEMTGGGTLAEGGTFHPTAKLQRLVPFAEEPAQRNTAFSRVRSALSISDKSCTLCMETMPGTAHEKYVHVCAECTSSTIFDEDVLQAPDMPQSCPHHDQAVANCSCCHAGVVRMRKDVHQC